MSKVKTNDCSNLETTILFLTEIYTEYVIFRLNERHILKPLNINDNSEIVQIASKGHT